MAYFICHGLWSEPYVFDTHLGFCNSRCFEQGLSGGINYTIWVWNCVNGGHSSLDGFTLLSSTQCASHFPSLREKLNHLGDLGFEENWLSVGQRV